MREKMPLIDVVKLSQTECTQPIQAHLKYATNKNFVGRVIDGYDPAFANIALMTPKAATALCKVQNELVTEHNVGLLIYDAYRPKRAVRDFFTWSQQAPANAYELERKAKHYPNIEKSQLFTLGYLVEDSGHCYGNTVDLVLITASTGEKLDMGSRYDYMDPKSHIHANRNLIGDEAWRLRTILSTTMQKFGFHTYPEEYWHFSHGGEAGREATEPLDIEIRA
jgi:D-alanyl-D-alanine dipeptidase